MTHFLVPYAAALLALGAWRSDAPRRRVAWAVSFGIGGWAPDADAVVDWMSELWPHLYFLQHRGVSHSLVGAPLFALALAGALALPARRWKRLENLRWAPATVAAALLGSLTHLVLDSVTYGGVPLLWPFAFGRVMWPVFNWLVWWLFPIGLILLALHILGKLDRRAMLACGLAFVAVLAALAAARVAERPDAPPGGMVYPRNASDEWVVLRPEGAGWRAELLRGGEVANSTHFANAVPPDAEEAVARARATPDYKGFLMGRFGPEVVQARPWQGGWNVTFEAVAQRFEAQNAPRWTPADPDKTWGLASFHVGAEVRALVRGW